jgi:hypothetical protein
MPAGRRRARSAVSNRYVVDATVGQAASSTATAGVGKQCREFLMDIWVICHRVVMTDDIEREWRVHRSRFFVMWLSWMERAGKVAYVRECQRADIRACIEQARDELGDAGVTALLEDIHLVEAALATDNRIVSLEVEAPELLARVEGIAREVDGVQWLNPAQGARAPGRR